MARERSGERAPMRWAEPYRRRDRCIATICRNTHAKTDEVTNATYFARREKLPNSERSGAPKPSSDLSSCCAFLFPRMRRCTESSEPWIANDYRAAHLVTSTPYPDLPKWPLRTLSPRL